VVEVAERLFDYGALTGCEVARVVDTYEILHALRTAQERGDEWRTNRHDRARWCPGNPNARSLVRAVLRSTAATSYVVRRQCMLRDGDAVVRIRPGRAR